MFPQNKQEQKGNSTAFVYEDVSDKKWESASSVNRVLKSRAEATGLPYFSAHKFRHLSIHLALQKCKNGEEIKAVTQNFGHEDVRTALQVYGNLSNKRLIETLDRIDKNSSDKLNESTANAILQLVQEKLKKEEK